MYMLNGWWFLSSGGSYPPVFTVGIFKQELQHLVSTRVLEKA